MAENAHRPFRGAVRHVRRDEPHARALDGSADQGGERGPSAWVPPSTSTRRRRPRGPLRARRHPEGRRRGLLVGRPVVDLRRARRTRRRTRRTTCASAVTDPSAHVTLPRGRGRPISATVEGRAARDGRGGRRRAAPARADRDRRRGERAGPARRRGLTLSRVDASCNEHGRDELAQRRLRAVGIDRLEQEAGRQLGDAVDVPHRRGQRRREQARDRVIAEARDGDVVGDRQPELGARGVDAVGDRVRQAQHGGRALGAVAAARAPAGASR